MVGRARVWCAIVFAVVLGSCSDGSDRTANSSSEVFVPSGAGSIIVDLEAPTTPFDRRLLGTNAPAWIGPERLADPRFRQQVSDLGATVIRMPGGSWSNSYDWLACERRDESGCFWPWAARPSDYVAFLAATGIDGMWTVSFNETAEQAAALVAFFNGAADDARVIGVDRNGVDWGTVGTWAAVRAAGGHPEAQRIELFEVGNEIFGAKPEASGDCASFGWEDVWTCDGAAYVHGDEAHDGFTRFREAMQAVDPNILVGAVGIGGAQSGWGDFGNEVISGTAGELDFYVIHHYGFDSTRSYREVVRRPQTGWRDQLSQPLEALDSAGSDGVPLAVTEYNLVAFEAGDELGMMAEAVNAFYIADTIGQMAVSGASMANQWNLVNGVSETGSDYGLIDPETATLNPQYFAIALWSRFGTELLAVENGFDAANEVSVYAGRREDGSLTLLVLNKTDDPIDAKIRLKGGKASLAGMADVLRATALDDRDVTFNGVDGPIKALPSAPATSLPEVNASGFSYTFPALSIVLLELR